MIEADYNFETPLEQAIAIVLAKNSVAVYSASSGLFDQNFADTYPDLMPYLLTPLTFERQRPRVDLFVRVGGGQGIMQVGTGYQPLHGFNHDLARSLALVVRCVTPPEIVLHRAYVARLRFLMATILREINGDEFDLANDVSGQRLVRHRVAELRDAGTDFSFSPDQGYFSSDLNFDGQLTFQNE